MKHPILIAAFLLLPFLSFSQGITFEQGTWKDALVLAKKTNKPVLLYVYFSDVEVSQSLNESWNRSIFSSGTVGDVCNTYFVCYRMDASKKEGLELAKKHGLTFRPAVLFVNAEGTLLSNIGSLMDANDFIEGAKKVLLDLKAPKPMTAWEAEFPQKKKDSAFLLEYLNKRVELGLPINEVFDAYLRLIPASGPMPQQAAKLFQLNSDRLLVTDYAYQYFYENRKAYVTTIATIYGEKPVERNRIFQFEGVVSHTVDVATLFRDEALLKKAVAAFQQLPYDIGLKQAEELYMDYYKQINEPKKYLAHARLFMADIMKKLDSEALLMKDIELMKMYERELASETDSVRIKSLLKTMNRLPAAERSELCRRINGLSLYIFQTFSDVAVLKEALTWSDKTIQWYPTSSQYLDTNANILYKLGRKMEAGQ